MTLKPPRTRPPEVTLDVYGRQALAPGFRRYEYCAGHCGWLIGCGDAIDTIWHQSCWDKAHPARFDGSPGAGTMESHDRATGTS